MKFDNHFITNLIYAFQIGYPMTFLFHILFFCLQSNCRTTSWKSDSQPNPCGWRRKGSGSTPSNTGGSTTGTPPSTSNTLTQNAASTTSSPTQEPVCQHMINGMVYLNVVNLPVTDIIKRIACYTKQTLF